MKPRVERLRKGRRKSWYGDAFYTWGSILLVLPDYFMKLGGWNIDPVLGPLIEDCPRSNNSLYFWCVFSWHSRRPSKRNTKAHDIHLRSGKWAGGEVKLTKNCTTAAAPGVLTAIGTGQYLELFLVKWNYLLWSLISWVSALILPRGNYPMFFFHHN